MKRKHIIWILVLLVLVSVASANMEQIGGQSTDQWGEEDSYIYGVKFTADANIEVNGFASWDTMNGSVSGYGYLCAEAKNTHALCTGSYLGRCTLTSNSCNFTTSINLTSGQNYYIGADATNGKVPLDDSPPSVADTGNITWTHSKVLLYDAAPIEAADAWWGVNTITYDEVIITPEYDTLNISDTNPLTNSQWNISTINFNATVNSTTAFNCSLLINDTINLTSEFTAGSGVLSSFNQTFNNGYYNYSFRCYNSTGGNEENTTGLDFFIDTTTPSLYTPANNEYFTMVHNLNFTATDTNLYSVMINSTCTTDNLTTGVNTPHNHNNSYDISSCAAGQQQTNITACDGATAPLNCITTTYTWYAQSRLNISGSNKVNSTAINHFSIFINGTLAGSTTTGTYNLDNLSNGASYFIQFNSTGFENKNYTYTVNATLTSYQFNIWTAQSFNFTIRNEETGNVINGSEITVEFISTSNVYNYSTTTGYLYVDLLVPEDYVIRYYGAGWGRKRHKYYTLQPQSYQNMSLYLINSTDSVTVTVYDELTLNTIPYAVIYLQRYFQDENTYKTVAEYTTDVSGKAYFDVKSQTEYYKWLVDYPWKTRKLETNEEYIEETSINLYIGTTNTLGDNFYKEDSIQYSLSYVEGVKQFSLTYTDSSAVGSEYCFYVLKYGQYNKETINSSCTTSSSSTIALSGLDENTSYYSLFTATIEGEVVNIATGFVDIPSTELNAGRFGMFMAILLVVVLVFLSQVHLLALLLGSSGLMFAKLLGLIPLGWGYIISVFISAIILAIIIEMRK